MVKIKEKTVSQLEIRRAARHITQAFLVFANTGIPLLFTERVAVTVCLLRKNRTQKKSLGLIFNPKPSGRGCI
jgi:hypothetical protein